jgi:DNA polymerase III sliding clamp (beta) subunit (PCNA family)
MGKEVKQTQAPIHIPTLLACSLFASKDETRYYLNGVYVEARPGGVLYCATNGHQLLTRFIEDSEVDVSDFLIIPARVCKTWKRPEEIESGTLTFGALEASIAFDEITVSFTPVQGSFPHFAALVPDHCSGDTAQFNGNYVASFEKAAKILFFTSPVFNHNGPDPAVISFSEDSQLLGLLMPMRKECGDYERPDWLDKIKGTVGEMPPVDSATGEVIEDIPVADRTDAIRTMSEAAQA